jgi:large subunit ribosomal protein L32
MIARAHESDTNMAVPKRRTAKARQGKRRSHLHLKPKQNTYCTRCGEAIRHHTVCWHCGWLNSQAREAIVIDEAVES